MSRLAAKKHGREEVTTRGREREKQKAGWEEREALEMGGSCYITLLLSPLGKQGSMEREHFQTSEAHSCIFALLTVQRTNMPAVLPQHFFRSDT